MADPVIRLDKSKPHGTVHGERMPDDPHYKVAFWQGGRLNGKAVQLPFDVHGELVPDDGKTAIFKGTGQDAKGNTIPVDYHPLYAPLMREFLKAKTERIRQVAAPAPGGAILELDGDKGHGADELESAPADDEINFVSWLKGEANYPPGLLRDAARKRFGTQYPDIYPHLVIDLVFDHKLVPQGEVRAEFQAMVKKANFTDDSVASVVKNAPIIDRRPAPVDEEAAA